MADQTIFTVFDGRTEYAAGTSQSGANQAATGCEDGAGSTPRRTLDIAPACASVTA